MRNHRIMSAELWPSPFFLRLPSNAFPDIGSVGRIEKKKIKKNHKKSRNKGWRMVPRKTWVSENFGRFLEISEAFLVSLEVSFFHGLLLLF